MAPSSHTRTHSLSWTWRESIGEIRGSMLLSWRNAFDKSVVRLRWPCDLGGIKVARDPRRRSRVDSAQPVITGGDPYGKQVPKTVFQICQDAPVMLFKRSIGDLWDGLGPELCREFSDTC